MKRLYLRDRPTIVIPSDCRRLWPAKLSYEQEHFWVLLLNARNRVFAREMISKGTLDATIVHPRDVFRRAIRENAGAVILVHNHPSGEAKPSNEDMGIARRLGSVGEIIGIEVIDNLIIVTSSGKSEKGYSSMKEAGLMNWTGI